MKGKKISWLVSCGKRPISGKLATNCSRRTIQRVTWEKVPRHSGSASDLRQTLSFF
nr:hypothetical protein [Escherichia coli]